MLLFFFRSCLTQIKEAARIGKPRPGAKEENAEKLLNKLQQSVNVAVALINMCRLHNKVIAFHFYTLINLFHVKEMEVLTNS